MRSYFDEIKYILLFFLGGGGGGKIAVNNPRYPAGETEGSRGSGAPVGSVEVDS